MVDFFFHNFFFHSIFFSLNFFSLDLFSLFMYQGLERKKISHNANYLVCFVLYDPSLDQRILLRKEQINILKLKIKLIGSFIYDKIQRQSTDFPLHYFRH